MSLPDALLKGSWGEVDAPSKFQTLGHPQLVQLDHALPVPAHLFNRDRDPDEQVGPTNPIGGLQGVYLSTSAETAWVQEGEDIEADRSGQQTGEVCCLQGEPSAHAQAQKPQLLLSTVQHQVLQHLLPLTVRPPIELEHLLD